MTRSISKLLFFLIFPFNSALFGQGRVDNDPILHDIWWKTYKIDSDTNLTCTLNSTTSQSKLTKIVAYYSRRDSIQKIVELLTIPSGTQMTSVYVEDKKPIFISVLRNNYSLSTDSGQYLKALTSFDHIVDTVNVPHASLYKISYQSEYFYYQKKVRYSNIMTENGIQVDNDKDKAKGFELYNEWNRLLVTKQ